jgi:hypothetical protein
MAVQGNCIMRIKIGNKKRIFEQFKTCAYIGNLLVVTRQGEIKQYLIHYNRTKGAEIA